MQAKMTRLLLKIQEITVIQSIRYSLVTLIPVLMIGSFALMIQSIPIDGYQEMLHSWGNGMVLRFFDGIYNITFGMLSVYTAAMVGYHFGILYVKNDRNYGQATCLVALGCFFILSGAPNTGMDVFAAQGMFTAILSASTSSFVFIWLSQKIRYKTLLTDGADIRLGMAIQNIVPAACTIGIFAGINLLLLNLFHVTSVYELLMQIFNEIFAHVSGGFFKGLLFVFVSSFLWFFGIHGSNVLEGVSNHIFQVATQVNLELVSQGKEATEILTKQFIDNFVLMGGCGTTICLLGALLLFSKRSNTRQIAKISVLPMIFNVNEIIVFGLPIIYNATFIIPFLFTPIVCFLTTYLCMRIGLVPLVIQDVKWTTPIFFSGYMATGSIAGSILQLVNLCLGIGIYAPFIKRYDREKFKIAKRDYQKLVKKLQESELTRIPVRLTDGLSPYSWMGKALAADLQVAMENQELQLHYQPQYHADGSCIGAEALLRWQHDILGNIYPPLVFQLAEEAGFLQQLEEWVVGKAASDIYELQQKFPHMKLKISANVTGITIQSQSFEKYLKNLSDTYPMMDMGMCLEITEQAALQLDDNLRKRFHNIREMGYMLAVDDFSMGSTSIQYLTGNHFNLVKLDGGLVKGILENPRCCEIISSIIRLAESLEMKVLAEYVSDAAIQEKLLELGCYLYQGWYYSPAIPFEEFEASLEKINLEK